MHYCNKCLGTIPNHLPDEKICSRCIAEDELETENKRLRELLKDAVSGYEYSWEWKHPSMDWVEVQVSKRTLVDIDKALKGGGE